MTIASYWVEGVSAKSTHQREALLFMHYLAQKETAQKFYTEAAKTRAFGEPYARTDLADTLKENELVYPFVSQLKNATSSYLVSDTHDGEGGLNSASTIYLGNAINAMVIDGTSTSSVLDTLTQGLAQTLSKYGIQ
jgi:multiple sugar transport system substrate-binding protein